MAYTVFGFRAGTLDTVRLHVESLKAKASLAPFRWQERMMRGFAVEAEGFDFLEKRFNVAGRFENLVLLDDVAIEACRALGVEVGTPLGAIELSEMGGLAIKMFAWAYFSPASEGVAMIEAGDTVTVSGEEGVWEVDMAGNGTDIVRIIKNHDAATWRMISLDQLVLVAKPKSEDGPRLIPKRSKLD
jgi:hypothetical protein